MRARQWLAAVGVVVGASIGVGLGPLAAGADHARPTAVAAPTVTTTTTRGPSGGSHARPDLAAAVDAAQRARAEHVRAARARAERARLAAVVRLARALATTTTSAPHDAPNTATQALAGDAPTNVGAIQPRAGLPTLGRIRIPAIGLDQPLYEGIAQYFIDAGPTHWPGTALPGQPGNVVIAGHRTTHTHPFYAIANTHPGDVILITTNAGRTYTYRITQEFVVPDTALWIKDSLAGSQLTIFTCHPIGSSAERYVVRATLVG